MVLFQDQFDFESSLWKNYFKGFTTFTWCFISFCFL